MVMTVALAGCASTDNLSFSSDNNVPQTVPVNYRPEVLAFLRTYLNDPRGVREAMIAEPALRKVGGRDRYVACLKFNARHSELEKLTR